MGPVSGVPSHLRRPAIVVLSTIEAALALLLFAGVAPEQVGAAVSGVGTWRGTDLVANLAGVLGDHEVPARSKERDSWKPIETEAACVHTGPYGTRSSTIVIVPAHGQPQMFNADGAPCTTTFRDVSDRW